MQNFQMEIWEAFPSKADIASFKQFKVVTTQVSSSFLAVPVTLPFLLNCSLTWKGLPFFKGFMSELRTS